MICFTHPYSRIRCPLGESDTICKIKHHFDSDFQSSPNHPQACAPRSSHLLKHVVDYLSFNQSRVHNTFGIQHSAFTSSSVIDRLTVERLSARRFDLFSKESVILIFLKKMDRPLCQAVVCPALHTPAKFSNSLISHHCTSRNHFDQALHGMKPIFMLPKI